MTKQEERNEIWFQKLVPLNGKSDTTEGEMLRAINKVFYRWYNDGDYFYEDYGIETAGAAHSYLVNESQLKEKLTELFNDITDKEYEKVLIEATDLVLDEIEKIYKQDDMHTNEIDMLDIKPMFEQSRYEENCW